MERLKEMPMETKRVKKPVSKETFAFLIGIAIFFGYIGTVMGVGPMFKTLMATAHDLLLNTVFFIMAIAVLAGAFAALMSEFGVVALINSIISPVMGPLYDLPGAASLGAITTFLSDNPAIISLAKDKGFNKYFEDYQTPALCNLGTAFGMGLILFTVMMSQGDGKEFIVPAALGVAGAVFGSIVSVKIMMRFTKQFYGVSKDDLKRMRDARKHTKYKQEREIRDGSTLERAMDAMLEGGKTGVQLGLDIVPGVLIITTIVMVLTKGPGSINGVAAYTGAAYEGVSLIPKLGAFLSPVIQPLFGFQSPEAIAFPFTSLGSAGAALALVPEFLRDGLIGGNEIAVFTSIGMCWSGYLSTHVGMMDALGVRQLASKAILSHTFGGIAAGVFAHYAFVLYSMF